MSVPSVGPVLRGALGVALGGGCLWLAFRSTSFTEVMDVLAGVKAGWIVVALLLYATDLSLRIIRWHGLMEAVHPVSRRTIAEVLLIGYAANNLLPARLGELFRADYARRRSGVSRSGALGSIVVERLLDGFTVTACLAAGLALAWGSMFAQEAARTTLIGIMIAAAAIMTTIAAGCAVMVRNNRSLPLVPRLVSERVAKFKDGLRSFGQVSWVALGGYTLLIWGFETAALWSTAKAVDVDLEPVEALILVGTVSLSTLVPTAPGYIGSYQMAFALCFGAVGVSAAAGIAAATLTQVFLLGAVTLSGVILYTSRSAFQLIRSHND